MDNLSESMDKLWLQQIFTGSGNVVDAFIPKKRSQRQNTRFGFVRLYSRKEADQAINYLNGVITRDHNFFSGIHEVYQEEEDCSSTD